jgi:hypothetical protein
MWIGHSDSILMVCLISSRSIPVSKIGHDRFVLASPLQDLSHIIHVQHKNTRTLPVEGSAHDNGRTIVCAEYGNTEGSPNPNG